MNENERPSQYMVLYNQILKKCLLLLEEGKDSLEMDNGTMHIIEGHGSGPYEDCELIIDEFKGEVSVRNRKKSYIFRDGHVMNNDGGALDGVISEVGIEELQHIIQKLISGSV